ncbi:MAG: hypothetical protein K9H84_07405 [Bacteroidales bacterium]|nr:hypothetical protein [Bacteroidales bacterium]
MENIRIKELIEFRSKSDRAKRNFAHRLKQEPITEIKSPGSGGNYWVSCLSAINNAFKHNEMAFINEKIQEIDDKIKRYDRKSTKEQFQRNIDILENFIDFSIEEIRPDAELKFHTKPKEKSIIHFKNLFLKAQPDHVFSFSRNKSDEIGAVWFIAQLDGYTKSELGMFTEILYRYLKEHYEDDFYINSTYCVAIDVFNNQMVRYEDINQGKVSLILEQTIDEITKLL